MLSRLATVLGSKQAAHELRWLRAAVRARAVDADLDALVARRVRGEPLQYILGTQPFGPLNLLVRPPVLIPRPETEHWVLRLADVYRPQPHRPVALLDLGTGTGCIPLLLCHLWPPGSVCAHGLDISPHARRLAQDNATLCSISPAASQQTPHNTFSVTSADILAADFADTASSIRPSFDVITSNPPYIPWKDRHDLPHSVINFEDHTALFGGPSGLDFYHAIARFVSHRDILNPGALVALEVGHDQAATVQDIMRQTGKFRHTEIWPDPWGKQRTVIAHAHAQS